MDNKDFDSIYNRNYRRSFLFSKSYVHDDMAAEDIVAESLVKYWKLISSGETDISDALLLTILKNKSLDYLRHQAIQHNVIENMTDIMNREINLRISTLEACDPSEIFSKEIRKIVKETLLTLPEQTQHVFRLSRFENKSVKEIAEITGLTVKGVEYHITKSLKIMKSNLKDYMPLLMFLMD
ncbi:RNA polymerase sigma-70 factor [Parabacteroides chinchillae]